MKQSSILRYKLQMLNLKTYETVFRRYTEVDRREIPRT